MSEKIKKISINKLQQYVDDNYNNYDAFEWNGMDVVITKTISFEDLMAFVDGVTKSCFMSETGEYVPEAKDFAIRSLVLEMYANFNMPKNLNERYYLIYNSGVFEEIIERINKEQFRIILQAIDRKIEYLANANIESVTKQLNELWNAIDKLETSFENLFNDISADDIKDIIGAISNTSITEEGLVKAFINNTKSGD